MDLFGSQTLLAIIIDRLGDIQTSRTHNPGSHCEPIHQWFLMQANRRVA